MRIVHSWVATLRTRVQVGMKAARRKARKGIAVTPAVLFVFAAAASLYGFTLLPDEEMPKPAPSWFEIDFPAGAPARDVAVDVNLDQEGSRQTLFIAIKSDGLRSPSWSIYGQFPSGGVPQVTGVQPRVQRMDSDASRLWLNPGRQPDGDYSLVLEWPSKIMGPYRINDSSFAARFPEITVQNHDTASSGGVSQPSLSVDRRLAVNGDYAFVGGDAPSSLTPYQWQWRTEAGAGGVPIVAGITAEATSPSRAASAHSDEFLSGIAFGVGAAALIAAMQEFLNRATSDEDGNGDPLFSGEDRAESVLRHHPRPDGRTSKTPPRPRPLPRRDEGVL